jgi:hypothetical protein
MKQLFIALMTTSLCFSQWTNKTINSDFDGTFKKSYTETNNRGFLAMEQGISSDMPLLYLCGSYFCDDSANIDLVFTVSGESKRYNLRASKSRDSKYYFFSDDIWTDEFINDFKTASKCLIRVNQEYCQADYYSFNMSGSTSALNFLKR